MFEGVDPGGVAVAPLDLDGVPPHQADAQGPHVGGNAPGVECPLCLSAPSAGTAEPEVSRRIDALVPILPADAYVVFVGAGDLDGDWLGRGHERSPLAPGSETDLDGGFQLSLHVPDADLRGQILSHL